MPVAPVARALAPLSSISHTASAGTSGGATVFHHLCRGGTHRLTGSVSSNSWAPMIPVDGAAVEAVVLGHRAMVNSWVLVDPVVRGAVRVVVVRPRAMLLRQEAGGPGCRSAADACGGRCRTGGWASG